MLIDDKRKTQQGKAYRLHTTALTIQSVQSVLVCTAYCIIVQLLYYYPTYLHTDLYPPSKRRPAASSLHLHSSTSIHYFLLHPAPSSSHLLLLHLLLLPTTFPLLSLLSAAENQLSFFIFTFSTSPITCCYLRRSLFCSSVVRSSAKSITRRLVSLAQR